MRTIHVQVPPGRIRFILYTVVVALLIAMVGCSTPRRRGGTLSGAATEASKPPEEQKTVVQRDPDPYTYDSDESDEESDDDSEAEGHYRPATRRTTHPHRSAAYRDSLYGTHPRGEETIDFPPRYVPPMRESSGFQDTSIGYGLGVFATRSRLEGDIQDRFSGMGLQLSIGRELPFELGLRGYATAARFGDRGAVTAGLREPFELGAEAYLRHKHSPAHTFASLYSSGGFRLSRLAWKFTNPIQVSEGGEVRAVEGDNLRSFSAYVAFGAVLFQRMRFQPEVELQAGYRFWQSTTGEGFANDVFSNRGFLQLVVAIVIRTE